MDDTQLDDLIRRRIDLRVPRSKLLIEAATVSSSGVRRGGPSLPTGIVVVTLTVAAATLWLVGKTPSAGGEPSAALDIGVGHLVARLDQSSVSLDLAATGTATPVQVASSSGGPSRPFVAQVVCGPNEPLSGMIVLFGYVAPDVQPQVEGLPSGQSSAGGDGTFLFVTDGSAPAGATWTVRSATGVFAGTVAHWGVRQIAGSPRTSSCIVYDPLLEPEKP